MSKSIHQREAWPRFRWRREALAEQLAAIRHHQVRLIAHMDELGSGLRAEAKLSPLTEDVLKAREILGEILDKQMHSFIARRLGLNVGALIRAERHVEGSSR